MEKHEEIDPAPSTQLPEIDDPSAKRPDGMPLGRPFQPGVCSNPGGRPKDPIAALVRKSTLGGEDLVRFLVAVVKDDVDGREIDRLGVDEMLSDAAAKEKKADEMEAEAAAANDAGVSTIERANPIRKLRTQAADIRARAEAYKRRLSRKRKIPAPLKTRVTAAQILLERGWGKALERVDLTVGNPDGSNLGTDGRPLPDGPLAHLTGEDLAQIGEVLERATKRTEIVEVKP